MRVNQENLKNHNRLILNTVNQPYFKKKSCSRTSTFTYQIEKTQVSVSKTGRSVKQYTTLLAINGHYIANLYLCLFVDPVILNVTWHAEKTLHRHLLIFKEETILE